MNGIVFERRTSEGVRSSADPAEIWPLWKGNEERWLFVAPHDDDIVLGAGLHFVAAIECKIPTFAVVSTTGEAGYCRPEHRGQIAEIRRRECKKSFELLGLAAENLFLFDYPDANLAPNLGHRPTEDPNCATAIEGATGFQNSFTWILRKVKPSRVFLPSQTDIHPDHKAVHEEFVISIFHASGNIWPELGKPIREIPKLYEYATYCDFIDPPTIRLRTSPELLEKKLLGVSAYKSQEQIESLVKTVRETGPVEYVRELEFNVFNPAQYDSLFSSR